MTQETQDVFSEEAEGDEAFGEARCESLLPGLPEEWYSWPVVISVAFTQTPVTCVYRKLFVEYTVRTMEDAVRTLCDPKNRQLFMHYNFSASGIVPAYGWYAYWPLARRGAAESVTRSVGSVFNFSCRDILRGVHRRYPQQGAAPWETRPDDTLFEIWEEPVNVYGSKTVYMLRVGGRTPETATQNWIRTSRVIRAYKAKLAYPAA